jgi:hypothetical protein
MNAFRNPDLHARIEKHPLKAALARCLDIAEEFHTDCEHVGMDRNLSTTGRASAIQKHLHSAIRDLRDARKPVEELKERVHTKRAAVKIPPFDDDTVGFLRRQELRAALKGMALGERQASLIGANASVDFVDAALEQHPVLSGFANNPMEMKSSQPSKKIDCSLYSDLSLRRLLRSKPRSQRLR